MDVQLKELTTLRENLGSIPNTTHDGSQMSVDAAPWDLAHSSDLHSDCTQRMMRRHTCRQNIHTHKNKYF